MNYMKETISKTVSVRGQSYHLNHVIRKTNNLHKNVFEINNLSWKGGKQFPHAYTIRKTTEI